MPAGHLALECVGEGALVCALSLDLEADAHASIIIVPFVGHLGPILVVDPSSVLVAEAFVVSLDLGNRPSLLGFFICYLVGSFLLCFLLQSLFLAGRRFFVVGWIGDSFGRASQALRHDC